MASSPRINTASQVVFADSDVGTQYKSLYLDTLGDAAKRARSPVRGSGSPVTSGIVEGTWRPSEHYIHGTLTTQGIEGASVPRRALPIYGDMVHSLVKDWSAEDHSMSPRRRHPEQVNRPKDNSLTTRDICGAQPASQNVLVVRPRDTNPLQPEYQLPASPQQLVARWQQPAEEAAPTRDPLRISDIEGTKAKPRCRSPECGRALVVEDIEGAKSSWRPHHKQHFGVNLRDAGLHVTDINKDLPRHKLLQHADAGDWADKGDPAGPRATSPVKPRTKTTEQDNSLRTMDIEGVRLVARRDNDPFVNKFVRRQAKTTVTSCADIEGAQAADRDKVHLFERRKAATAASEAAKAAGSSVLQQLSVDRQQVEVLWNTLKKKDREGSGLVTGTELQQALSAASVEVPQARWPQLLVGLQDNAGLVNYLRFTKQLFGRCQSGGGAAPAANSNSGAAAAAAAAAEDRNCDASAREGATTTSGSKGPTRPSTAIAAGASSSRPGSSQQRPHTAATRASSGGAPSRSASAAGSRRSSGSSSRPHTAAAGTPAARLSSSAANGEQQAGQDDQGSCSASQLVTHYTQQYYSSAYGSMRPSSAPAAGKHLNAHKPEPFRNLSHWFGGSLRDAGAPTGLVSWRPTHDANRGLSPAAGSAEAAAAAMAAAAAAGVGVDPAAIQQYALAATTAAECQGAGVPEWMVGTTDPAVAVAVQQSRRWGGGSSSGGGGSLQPAVRPATANAASRTAANKAVAAAAAASRLRPSSAAGRFAAAAGAGRKDLGLAERRREAEGARHDLATVRQLQ